MTVLRTRAEEPTSGSANQKLRNWLRTRYRSNVKADLIAGAISREKGVITREGAAQENEIEPSGVETL